jgi:hypothetical protein
MADYTNNGYTLTFTTSPSSLAAWWYDNTQDRAWYDVATKIATALPSESSPVSYGNGFKYDKNTNSYSVQLEAPGYKRNEISVEVPDEISVVITAKNERRGTSTRTFYLHDLDLNASTVSAALEDGILTVTVKAPPVRQPVKIEVR